MQGHLVRVQSQLEAGAEGLDRLRCTVEDGLDGIRYAVRENGRVVTKSLEEIRGNSARLESMIRDAHKDSQRTFKDLSSKLDSVQMGVETLQAFRLVLLLFPKYAHVKLLRRAALHPPVVYLLTPIFKYIQSTPDLPLC